ncbi:MAG: protein phosphatase, partial [Chloroflexi bacterium]
LCFHASPKSNIDVILPSTPYSILDDLFADTTADIMAGGHTHRQMLRKFHDRLIVNPGSVGTSFATPPPNNLPMLSPWVEYTIIETIAGSVQVSFHRLPMDVPAVLEAVRQSHMPNSAWWLRQYQT